MADEGANGGLTPGQSSFKGRLDVDSFKFQSGSTLSQTSSITTTIRRSTRLSTSINTSFKATKTTTSALALGPSSRKRKAGTLPDTIPALPDGSTAAQEPSPSTSSTPAPSTSTKPPPKKKRTRQKAGYAPPSVYAHLPLLPDALAPNLLVLFCGLNPGIRTAQTGHAYSHPSNRFWPLMRSSGVLPVPCTADEDRTLPARFSLGLTNIVGRPSRNGAELSRAEMDDGVAALEAKVRMWRPEVVCVVGKSIWESLWRVRHDGRAVGAAFRYGWQEETENMGMGDLEEGEEGVDGVVYDEGWRGARVFVATSTSGLAATPGPAEKERIWRELGVWVEQRRDEREAERSE